MGYVLLLLGGMGASAFLIYAHSIPAGLAGMAGTLALVFVLIRRKQAAIMRDPVKREAMIRTRKELERKLGITNTILENGVDARAVILKIHDTENRSGVAENPELIFTLRVSPEFGETFQTETKRYVPAVLLPQFQPGKELRIKFDRENRGHVEFISFSAENDVTVNLRDYPLK